MVNLQSKLDLPHNLRRQTLIWLGVVLGIGLLLVLASFFIYANFTEETFWAVRQEEATRNASLSITHVLQRAQDFIRVIDAVEHEDEHITDVMNALFPVNPTVAEIVIIEEGQIQRAATQDQESILANDVTISQSNWYIRALEDGAYLSDVFYSSENTPYVVLAERATDGDDVIAARLRMEVLREALQSIQLGETGDAYLIDLEGNILSHADDSAVALSQSIADSHEYAAIMNAPDYQWQGEYTNVQGEDVLGASTSVPNSPWIVVTEIETNEAFATTRNAMLLRFVIVLIIGAIFLWLSRRFLITRYFRPLENLQQGALRVETGDMQTLVPVTRMDEIGQLTETFNIMMHGLSRQAEEMRGQTIALQQEVDERKRTEVELEQAVADLIVANEKAEEVSRLKSEFLATMSHELRTPMSAIIGFSGIMLEGVAGSVDDEGREMVEGIYHSGQHLLGLINNMLDLAKIEAGRLEIHPVPLSLPNLAEEMRERFAVLANQKHLQFTVQIDPLLPTEIIADRTRLTQIMTNLVGNAIKFTEKGQVDLILNRKDDTLVIKVRDTGVGIPPHALDYIFDEFRQVDGSSRRIHGGTGLGLAIVRKLGIAMGGQVTVQSVLEQGSTFTITVPFQEVHVDVQAS
jgi:signal transduction histidine kinase